MTNKRDKYIYENYVCPRCFHKLPDCTCPGSTPPYQILWIDENIQEHVRILNEKGYLTEYSCESHSPKGTTHIMFYGGRNPSKDIPLPNRFKWHDKYNKFFAEYDKKMSLEDYQLEKKKNLDALLEWCNELPNNNIEI